MTDLTGKSLAIAVAENFGYRVETLNSVPNVIHIDGNNCVPLSRKEAVDKYLRDKFTEVILMEGIREKIYEHVNDEMDSDVFPSWFCLLTKEKVLNVYLAMEDK